MRNDVKKYCSLGFVNFFLKHVRGQSDFSFKTMNFNRYINIIRDKNLLIFILFVCAMLTQFSCRKPFEPTLNSPQTGYLVVEGFINVKGVTAIELSRTKKLEEQVVYKPELKANVQIIGENSNTYEVKEKTNGLYESDILDLPAQKYHLKIKTADGKEYESKLIEGKPTPPIDSLSWEREQAGVGIKVNSHDDQNKTKYYKWTYDEVWEIHANVPVIYKFINQINPSINTDSISVVNRTLDEQKKIYYCWQNNSSSEILLGSSAKLSKDIISSPINFIPNDNVRLAILYSINVKQTALDLDGYNFYLNLKNNTETNGSIFDHQPSETTGNIVCLTDPQEQVIGYVGVATVEEKRIFIQPLPDWNYKFLCNYEVLKISLNQDTLAKYVASYQPIDYVFAGPVLIGYQVINSGCADCATRGDNKRPSFWPN
ncbi:DUF4249 domain-containing protein [Pedobacter sp. SD-b]|uniref:DUF4249 domain-containing protein n=1 Tax=Pedobacter segetis TaxID=2793069 RepID=A0ABS1BMF9_9SPHI|nr:DUF4249 domain-containing protein [Pedobacter segetis]MBK0383931.1 DUF4249 domain-containing protein [Pedobacter segetis]